jgi:hypothetical protein
MRWIGHVASMGGVRSAYKIFIRKPEGKRPLGRPRRRWEGVDWVHVTQDRDQWRGLVNAALNL